MKRITEKMLEEQVDYLNELTGHSTATYSKDSTGQFVANIGTYYIDYAYGGACLNQIINTGGGVTCPLGSGHEPKRALYDKLRSYIYGIQLANHAKK